MEERDDIRKELNELAPGFPAKPTYEPPAGYFDQLPDRLLDNWNAASRKQHKTILFRRIVAAAAIISGLVIGLFCWDQKPVDPDPMDGISNADAFAYIHENISEFDALINAEAIRMPNVDTIQLPPSDAEQYLLEELDEAELEQLF